MILDNEDDHSHHDQTNQMCSRSFKEKAMVWVVVSDKKDKKPSWLTPTTMEEEEEEEGSFTTAVAIPYYNYPGQDQYYVLFFAASRIEV